MDFAKFLNENHDQFCKIISKDNFDSNRLSEDVTIFCDNLIKLGLDMDSNFKFEESKYIKKEEKHFAPDTKIVDDYVIMEESNSFDLFYELVSSDKRISQERRKEIFLKIQNLANGGDINAKVALAMCLFFGVFMKKNIADAQFKLHDYAINHDCATAQALLAQYWYFQIYKKSGNLKALSNAKQFLKLAISKNSNMARYFNGKYKLF